MQKSKRDGDGGFESAAEYVETGDTEATELDSEARRVGRLGDERPPWPSAAVTKLAPCAPFGLWHILQMLCR